MRQYLIVSRIYLILSVINFALAAPLVIRERHEARVKMVDVTKDGTAASQIRSRWDPRDGGSGSNEKDVSPGPELSGESDPERGPNSPSSETGSEESGFGSEAGSNYNSPSMPSSSASSAGSPHAYSPQGWRGVASHDAIADGDQLLGWDHAPQWSSVFDDTPSRIPTSSGPSDLDIAADGLLSLHSYSTGSESTSSGSTGSESTVSESSSGSTGSDDAIPESETFLGKLLRGKIAARTSGSRTVNAAQRELQDTLDSRAYVPFFSLSCKPSNISSHIHSDFDPPQLDD
jgi:hypothetical protein